MIHPQYNHILNDIHVNYRHHCEYFQESFEHNKSPLQDVSTTITLGRCCQVCLVTIILQNIDVDDKLYCNDNH